MWTVTQNYGDQVTVTDVFENEVDALRYANSVSGSVTTVEAVGKHAKVSVEDQHGDGSRHVAVVEEDLSWAVIR